MVHPAAAAHRVLLQRAQPRQRLAGVADPGAGAGDGVDPGPGRGGDAGQVGEQVQRGALGGQDAGGRAGEHQRRSPGHQRRRRPAPADSTTRSAPEHDVEHRERDRAAGQHPGLPRGDGRPARAGRRGTVASVVTSGPSRRSSARARSMTAATWSADKPGGGDRRAGSASVRPMRPPRPRLDDLGADDAVDLPRPAPTAPSDGAGPGGRCARGSRGTRRAPRRRRAARTPASARLAVSTDQPVGEPGRRGAEPATVDCAASRPTRSRPMPADRLIAACSAERPAGIGAGHRGEDQFGRAADAGQRHLGADRGGGPLPHHQALEQRVGRQPVRAVQAGPGDLADREQARAPWCGRPGR